MNAWHDAENYAEKAQDYFENGRLGEAEEAIRQALELDPDRSEWLFNLGMTLEARGINDEAVLAFEQAANNAYDDSETIFASAVSLIRLKAYISAENLFKRVIEIDPFDSSAHVELLDAYLSQRKYEELELAYYFAIEMLDEPTSSLLMVMADSLIAQKDWVRAEWCLENAIEKDPGFPGLRSRLASVRLACGDFDGAIKIFKDELRVNPLDIELNLQLTDALIVASKKQEACKYLLRVIELEPANIYAHERLGHLYFSQGRFEYALESFDLVVKLQPDNLNAKLNLVRVLLALSQVKLAKFHLRPVADVIKKRNFKLLGRNSLAEASAALLATGNYELAEIAAEKALINLEIAKSSSIGFQVRKLLALAKYKNGNYDSGSLISKKILEDDPECLSSYFNLGLAAMKKKSYSEALSWTQKGLKIEPNEDSLRRLRMRIYLAYIKNTLAKLIKKLF